MYKIKYISLFIFLVFASGLYAQSDSANQGGEIVMTKEELKSFLKSVAEAKLKRMQAQREMQDKLGLAEAKAYYYEQLSRQQPYGYYPPRGYNQAPQQQDSRNLLFEIERLNNKVDYLLRKVNVNDSSVSDDSDETIVVPDNSTVAPSGDNDQNRQIAELQRKLDSLQKKEATPNNTVVSDLDALNQRFEELNNRLQNASKEERRSALEELLRKYGNFKKQVFFANNSSKVSASDMEYIDDVVQVLRRNPELSIVLEGYASPVGNANYNKRLSMRRAEAVQSSLESKGISSARIVAAFKGEDHSGSDAHARRVDMSIIIK